MFVQHSARIGFGKTFWGFSLLLALTGCSGAKMLAPQTANIARPPDIPNLALPSDLNQGEPANLLYADIAALDEQDPAQKSLKASVQSAIAQGLLQPATPEERFLPDIAITRRELARWMARQVFGHQVFGSMNAPQVSRQISNTPLAAKAGLSAKSPEASDQQTNGPFTDISTSDPDAEAIQALVQAGQWLPTQQQQNKNLFEPTKPVSRLALCQLYVRLSGHSDALAEDPAQTRLALKDLEAIPSAQRNVVATALQEGMLKTVFGLDTEALNGDTGLLPNKPVSRAEALRFVQAYLLTQTDPVTDNRPDASSAEWR